MSKNIIIAAGLVVVGIIGFVFPIGGTTIVERVTELGSGAGFSTDNVTEFGGVNIHTYRVPFKAATSTPAAVKSPAATSTLVYASCASSNGTTTAQTLTIGKGATPIATTTTIMQQAVAAGAQFTMTVGHASTTASVFAPNQFAVFGSQGGIGVPSYTGAGCVFRFIEN